HVARLLLFRIAAAGIVLAAIVRIDAHREIPSVVCLRSGLQSNPREPGQSRDAQSAGRGSAPGTLSDLAHLLRVGAEAQSNLAELYKISIVQLVLLLLDLVDDDAIVAAQVRDHEAPIVGIEV